VLPQRFFFVRAFAPLIFRGLALAGALAIASLACAQEVEVTSVKFANVRVPANLSSSGGGPGTWLEADIALSVKPPAGSPGQMVSRVRVTLIVGFELPALAGGERRLEHFRAEAECVALEAGRADVRFYLPPEVVKRDQLHGDPKYWGVEITAGGKAMTAARTAYSTTLATPDARKNFQTRASQLAAPNDGILQPQFLTPFAHEYPRATPSFVRRESR
jgi:hypothetical protein